MTRKSKPSITVLLVEDDPDLAEVLQKQIEIAGFAVQTADGGDRAWDMLITVQPGIVAPDIVVTDIGLPDGNGLELIRRIRNLRSVPIIAISGEDQIALTSAKQDGADAIFSKPVEPVALIDAITELTMRKP